MPFKRHVAEHQAERCIDCGNPYCQTGCPVHNYIPLWLELAKNNRIIEAAELCHRTNSLPEICGRICPQDRLCEGACTLNTGFEAVTIGAIERYITDTAFALGWRPQIDVEPTGKKVAIVGSGPAGLSCADVLVRHGIEAVVYERQEEVGGLLTFGIPEFKLEKRVVLRRREVLEAMGVVFHTGCEVGVDISPDQLLAEHDALFFATGAYTPKVGGLPNEDHEDVNEALRYLIGNTRNLLYETAGEDYISMENREVLVLGGGDTAMDCVRTAVRQGAAQVTCIYRRSAEEMPGSQNEVAHAIDEGVHFQFNRAPVGIRVGNAGDLVGVEIAQTRVENGELTIDRESVELVHADSVLVAFGYWTSPPDWCSDLQIELNDWGGVVVGDGQALPFQTNNPKVFAGGDNVRGADLVVRAVDDGRRAATSIIQQLGCIPISGY